jgi:hypothetical protein
VPLVFNEINRHLCGGRRVFPLNALSRFDINARDDIARLQAQERLVRQDCALTQFTDPLPWPTSERT